MLEKKVNRRRFVGLLAALPGAAVLLNACGDDEVNQMKKLATVAVSEAGASAARPAVNLPNRGAAPDFDNQSWINSTPLRLADLRGKVTLVEFWTFGCYNCQNVIPSLKSWYTDFSDKGLVIVGFHAPEFDHEKKLENVQEAVKKADIKYPVAQDNDFATWNKFRVRAWPTLFLVDKQGNIRYNHIGEGAYDETRAAIQALLAE